MCVAVWRVVRILVCSTAYRILLNSLLHFLVHEASLVAQRRFSIRVWLIAEQVLRSGRG